MKHSWNQLTWQPELQHRPVERTDAVELSEIQSARLIRARANRLYMVGELARAAQLLMELEMQASWAS
jgi:hypothetical protein